MGDIVWLDYHGPRRVAAPVRVPWPFFVLTLGRCLLAVAGLLAASVHCGFLWLVRLLSFGPGPPPRGPLYWYEFVFYYAWVPMLAGSVCAVLRLPRRAYAGCAALALPAVGIALYALTRERGMALVYGAYGVATLIGFLRLGFAADTTSDDARLRDGRRMSRLPGVALIWSALASPVGLFLVALFAIDPDEFKLGVLAWVFVVALPFTSFALSAVAWSHVDKNRERLRGRGVATVAWIVSSLSLIVALFAGIGMLG